MQKKLKNNAITTTITDSGKQVTGVQYLNYKSKNQINIEEKFELDRLGKIVSRTKLINSLNAELTILNKEFHDLQLQKNQNINLNNKLNENLKNLNHKFYLKSITEFDKKNLLSEIKKLRNAGNIILDTKDIILNQYLILNKIKFDAINNKIKVLESKIINAKKSDAKKYSINSEKLWYDEFDPNKTLFY